MRRLLNQSSNSRSSDRSATPDRAQYGLASLCGTCANHGKASGGYCQAKPPQAIRSPLLTPGECTGPPCCHRSARQVKQRQQQLHPQLLASIIHACCWPNAWLPLFRAAVAASVATAAAWVRSGGSCGEATAVSNGAANIPEGHLPCRKKNWPSTGGRHVKNLLYGPKNLA